MKNLTAIIIAILLIGALGLGCYLLWDWLQAHLFTPLASLPASYTAGLILGAMLLLYLRHLSLKITRLRNHASLIPQKAALYSELIFLLNSIEIVDPEEEAEYHDLKTQLSLVASHQVLDALLRWDNQPEADALAQTLLEDLLLAIRKDLNLPNRRLENNYFSDLLKKGNPSPGNVANSELKMKARNGQS